MLKKSLFNMQIDFEIFSIESTSFWEKRNSNGVPVGWDRFWYRLFCEYCEMFAKWELSIDTDNSNTHYVPGEDITITKSKTPRWYFYNFFITFLWKSINIFTIEEYNSANKFNNEAWRFIFRWAFYYFGDHIPGYIIDTYNLIKTRWENNRLKSNIVKRTRVDIAFDIDCPVFNYAKYTNISKTSKTAVKAYNPNDEWLYASFSYNPTKSNKWYGFRIYDKKKDTQDKNKAFWYWDALNDFENWQRIEYEVYPPYSHQCTDEELFSWFSSVLFWTDKVDKKIIWAPKSQYLAENSFKNAEKYAKNHWVSMGQLITDLNQEYFASDKISITEKLDTMAIVMEKTLENFDINKILNNEIPEQDLKEAEKYLITERWKMLTQFAIAFAWKLVE